MCLRMDDSLPSSVDVIVVGTGLPEAMLAAACARSGLSLLHLDTATFYGAEWASFNLNTLGEWMAKEGAGGEEEQTMEQEDIVSGLVHENETARRVKRKRTVHGIRDEWTQASGRKKTAEGGGDGAGDKTHKEFVEDSWRRFSIDLAPKLLLARGDLVNILVDSQVSAYAEFKMVDRLFGVQSSAQGDSSLYRIPCSRGEIFDSSALSMLDKRRLMKFLQFCMQWHKDPEACEPFKEFADRPFVDFLESQGITGSLSDLIRKSLSFLAPSGHSPSSSACLSSLCRFLDSVGAFGPSPFLACLYGSGELPQCFARLAAVFGGLYCLGRPVEAFIEKNGRVVAVIAAGQRIECGHLLLCSAFAPEEWRGEKGKGEEKETSTKTLRSILISHRQLLGDEDGSEHIGALNLAGIDDSSGGRLFEAGWEDSLAPKGYFLGHITSAASESSRALVDNFAATFYETGSSEDGDEKKKPLLLRRIQFEVDQFEPSMFEKAPENVAIIRLPDALPDYDDVVAEVKAVFARFWPDRDFLPRGLSKSGEDDWTEDEKGDEEPDGKKDGEREKEQSEQ